MIDKLVGKIKKLNAPIVVGLDPMLSYVPEQVQKKAFAELEVSIKGMLPDRMVSDIDFLINYYNPAVRMIGGWLYKMHFLKKILRFIRTNRKTR
jgi:hypothetical protein